MFFEHAFYNIKRLRGNIMTEKTISVPSVTRLYTLLWSKKPYMSFQNLTTEVHRGKQEGTEQLLTFAVRIYLNFICKDTMLAFMSIFFS